MATKKHHKYVSALREQISKLKIIRPWIRLKHFFLHNRYGKIITISVVSLSGLCVILIAGYYLVHRDEPLEIGVSFSAKYARELGVDWQANFTYLLDTLEFRDFRLMSYWDEHEKTKNAYDFTVLDWQMDEAAKRGAKVSLAVGERQPRWPECHHPSWVKSLDKAEFNQELLDYISQVVLRYRDHPALREYQLENEIFNNFFGLCEPVERTRLQAEYDLIKQLDSTHPVSINVASQEGFPPLREPIGDTIGFSVYRVAAGKFFGINYYWKSWYFTPQWHTLRAAFVQLVHGSPTFIHELQTEPWGPQSTVRLSVDEQNESMNIPQIWNNVDFAIDTGINRFYLWGGEWWYWRQTQFNDPSLTTTIQAILSKYRGQAQ